MFALAAGALGTFQYHLAQFTTSFDTFFGDRGDARGVVALCEHWYLSLRGKAELLSPGMFYPVKNTIGYSELLFGFGLPYSLVRATGLDMFSSLEVVVVALTFLNFVACFVLLYGVLRFHPLASCAGAMFFAFNSPKFFQTGHLQLQFVFCLPLIFICVILFVRDAATISQRRAFVLLSLAGLALNVQLLTAFYHGWFFVFWCFLFGVLALAFGKSRRLLLSLGRKFWPALAGSAATLVVGAVPFMTIYFPVARQMEWYAFDTNVAEMIPGWWSLFCMGDGNYVWGWLASVVRPVPWPTAWGELTIGVGVVTSLAWVAVTVYGVRLVVQSAGSRAVTTAGGGHVVEDATLENNPRHVYLLLLGLMILATTLFYLIGMKYWGGFSPWRYVYNYFPGAGAIRAMSRYVIFLTLPMSVAFAFVLSRGAERVAALKTTRGKALTAAAMILVTAFGIFEQFGVFKVGGTGFSKKVERIYLNAMAGRVSGDCEAFYVAARPEDRHNAFEYHYDSMLIAMMTGVPTVNGSSSQFPPEWHRLYPVKDPAYEENVRKWLGLHKVRGPVCRLELSPPVEAFDRTAPHPLDDALFFVRRHYRDFLGREPGEAELNGRLETLGRCPPADESCDRAYVSSAIFRSPEFLGRGWLVSRSYQVGLGRMPNYEEFTAEMQRLGGFATPEEEERTRAAFAAEFVGRRDFLSAHGGLTPREYVDKLSRAAELPPARKDELVADMESERRDAEQVLREITDAPEVFDKFYVRALVAMHYFGYLRRDPDAGGHEEWVKHVNATGDVRVLTEGFVDSDEYRQRFFGP
ncbi:MAG: hypothetical protein ACRD68_01240 [Pyrinomonadaceae bacterium]